MRKSGLADSPFFTPSPEHEVRASVPVSPAEHSINPLALYLPSSDHSPNRRILEQVNSRTGERVNTRTQTRANG